jgi:hypothetical protein
LPSVTPIERYARWQRSDGAPFDPWLRVHWRLGAEYLKTAPKATIITGTVAEWEDWTGMSFPESGEYVVPGALQPITINREQDVGTYPDPNIWIRHSVTGEELAEYASDIAYPSRVQPLPLQLRLSLSHQRARFSTFGQLTSTMLPAGLRTQI